MFQALLDKVIEDVSKNPSIEASVEQMLERIVTELNKAIFNGGNSFDPSQVKAFSEALAEKLPDLVKAAIENTQATPKAAKAADKPKNWPNQPPAATADAHDA